IWAISPIVYGATSAASSTESLTLQSGKEHLPAALDHNSFIDLFDIATRIPFYQKLCSESALNNNLRITFT
uniref:hypothetical protein n=1 Tax=Escherichia coli TaxID=562 RepID=UPI001BAAD859